MKKFSRADRAALAALDALYAELPAVACQGRCAIACGAVPLTDLEARRLQVVTHTKPRTVPCTTRTEAGRCVYLTEADRCRAYAIRPLICRVWGVVKMLSCPHGCIPDRWLSDLEFLRIGAAVERVGGGRVLRTSLDGLEHIDGGTYTDIAAQVRRGTTRPEAEVEADAERTRNLRALHGGRIIIALRETR